MQGADFGMGGDVNLDKLDDALENIRAGRRGDGSMLGRGIFMSAAQMSRAHSEEKYSAMEMSIDDAVWCEMRLYCRGENEHRSWMRRLIGGRR